MWLPGVCGKYQAEKNKIMAGSPEGGLRYLITDFDHTQMCYRASSGYVVREIADEFLLVPVQMQEGLDDQIAVINETGKFLWERLTEGSTVKALLQSMTEEYQVSQEEALADIIEFLSKLKEHKLLQESRGE